MDNKAKSQHVFGEMASSASKAMLVCRRWNYLGENRCWWVSDGVLSLK